MKMKHLPISERGDTIIEVLIATAIVSLVLTAAFALTNRNLLGVQDAQEQAYAQKLLQQQVEWLRASAVRPVAAEDKCYTALDALVDAPCVVANGGANYNISITQAAGTYKLQATWGTLTSQTDANITVYYRVPS